MEKRNRAHKKIQVSGLTTFKRGVVQIKRNLIVKKIKTIKQHNKSTNSLLKRNKNRFSKEGEATEEPAQKRQEDLL